MHETTFDYQYKTFKAMGGFGMTNPLGAINQMEFPRKDLKK
jgi:hypothetical protein